MLLNCLKNLFCVYRQVEDSTKASMDRLVNIWKERGVFEPSLTATLKQILSKEIYFASFNLVHV